MKRLLKVNILVVLILYIFGNVCIGIEWKDIEDKKIENEYNEYKESNEPSSGVLGKPTQSDGKHTIDEGIKEGQDFIQIGQSGGSKINQEHLNNASNTLYNILLGIGVFLAVAVGMFLGIKFMISSAEDKAKVKEALIPYIAGCVVIFGAFIIWKLTILLLGRIA